MGGQLGPQGCQQLRVSKAKEGNSGKKQDQWFKLRCNQVEPGGNAVQRACRAAGLWVYREQGPPVPSSFLFFLYVS